MRPRSFRSSHVVYAKVTMTRLTTTSALISEIHQGSISGHLRNSACAATGKSKSGQDAASARSRKLRVRPRTTHDAALQRLAAHALLGRGPRSSFADLHPALCQLAR